MREDVFNMHIYIYAKPSWAPTNTDYTALQHDWKATERMPRGV